MRKKLFVVSVALVVVIGGMLLAGSSKTAPTPAAHKAEAKVAIASTVQPAMNQEALCAEDLAGLQVLAEPLASKASCCQNHCVRDRDCDRFCGAKGAGDCVPVNSCCNQCACLF